MAELPTPLPVFDRFSVTLASVRSDSWGCRDVAKSKGSGLDPPVFVTIVPRDTRIAPPQEHVTIGGKDGSGQAPVSRERNHGARTVSLAVTTSRKFAAFLNFPAGAIDDRTRSPYDYLN
jgi:hypothetical protein